MTSQTVALVPVQDPGRAKSRLAPTVEPAGRRALVPAMLADVVGALAAAGVGRVVALTGGATAEAAARALGVDTLRDPPGGGLDGALAAAARTLRADTSLVVTADLPTLAADDVTALLATDGDVVVAPTTDGGTGGLLRRPAWVVPTSYGGRSAARHLLAARRRGLAATRVDLPGFALDVDVPADLEAARRSPTLGPATARLLERLDARSA